jgi:hypothetical protein
MLFASLHILAGAEGRVHGVAAARCHEVVALDRGLVLYLGNGETVPGCKYRE